VIAWQLVLAGGVLGLLVGSYVATLTLRWPQGRSAATGRSTCDGCGRPLSWYELVPLLSYAALRGRCRTCGAPIDRRHPAIEAAGAVIGAVSLWVDPDATGLLGALFGWALLTLAVLDVEHYWLPDAITLPLIGFGLALGMRFDPPFLDRLIGAVAGWALLAAIGALYQAMRRRRGMGGGDPKLFAAAGAWLGWQALPFVMVLASLIGLLSVAVASARGRAVTATTRLPFGAPLCVAAWSTWLAEPIARFINLR
jgi:leader peptidase (prepilin peptidase)/N-methyltransferase